MVVVGVGRAAVMIMIWTKKDIGALSSGNSSDKNGSGGNSGSSSSRRRQCITISTSSRVGRLPHFHLRSSRWITHY